MNLPKRTLILILVLVAITAVLLLVAFSAGKKATQQNTVAVPVTNVPPPPAPLSNAKTVLAISPSQFVVSGAGLQTLQVTIDTGENKVSAVELDLQYDPSVITNVALTPGPFLKNPSPLTNTVDPVKGQVKYALTQPLGSSGTSGTGVVATIQFSPTAIKKPTLIQLLPTSLASAEGISTSVLKTATGAEILFGTSANTTPTQ